MNHNCDVIDKRITEGTQNRFSESHSKPISEMPNFMICLIFLQDKAVHECIYCKLQQLEVFCKDKFSNVNVLR